MASFDTQDSDVTNFDYDGGVAEYSPEYFGMWFKRVVDWELSRAEREKQLSKTHSYEQTWLMSKDAWESLPENPTAIDIINAGGQFLGYQWVVKNESRA
jgi:hypothetical protein